MSFSLHSLEVCSFVEHPAFVLCNRAANAFHATF
jgi:hypothetical protein